MNIKGNLNVIMKTHVQVIVIAFQKMATRGIEGDDPGGGAMRRQLAVGVEDEAVPGVSASIAVVPVKLKRKLLSSTSTDEGNIGGAKGGH